MNEYDLTPDIPEHIWSAISDLLRCSLWNEIPHDPEPTSRMEALRAYCDWYYSRYRDTQDWPE